jgi:hypothetical protein
MHKDWFSHSKVGKVGETYTHRQHGDHISLLLFLQNKEGMQKLCILFTEYIYMSWYHFNNK